MTSGPDCIGGLLLDGVEMGHAVELITGAGAAAAAVHPLRGRILVALREPGTAAGVARELGLPRQRVTYHVRELERLGLLESVGERKRGNCVERLVRATARSYVIAPEALGAVGAAEGVRDRFSSSWLLAAAAQTIRDVGALREGAEQAGKRLPTFSLQTEVRFATPAAQHDFAEELAASVAGLVAKYHDEDAAGGRFFRLNLFSYPRAAGSRDVSDRVQR
jgi:DNA-binding transcriptional ArsR family regulator